MRKLSVSVLALFLALVAVGCDSGGDDQTDAELFVGTWALVNISDATGDQTGGFAGLANSLSIDLESDNNYTLFLDYKEDSGRQDLTLIGTYAVDNAGSLTLNVPAFSSSLAFSYDFDNDDQVTLSANSALVNPVFNPTTAYQGTVNVVIRRQ